MMTAAARTGKPRAHGTRACYVWGPEPGQGTGCRCAACTEANRADHQRRDRLRLYGQWQPFVDAGPVREHLEALSRAGIGWRRAAALSGVSTGAVSRILYGKPGRPPTRGVRQETAAAILAVRPGAEALAPSVHVDATGTRRRLQALVATGWSQSQLAERLEMLPGNFGQVMRREHVTAATARAVRDLYDELWNKPPAEATHRQKIAVSRARNHARAHGWAPPLAWDDDLIDNPAAGPAEGWRRPDGGQRRAGDLREDAEWLITNQGYTREHAAIRLGVTRSALDQAFARTLRASSNDHEEGSIMPFDPVPRQASEYQKGAAFAHDLFMRQHDAGVAAEQIEERHQAAATTLNAAARNDGEREFTRGYTETAADHLATLRAAQQAEQAAARWERAAEQQAEREAG
jgi:transcriptional regulator with XRE-family HTH domain